MRCRRAARRGSPLLVLLALAACHPRPGTIQPPGAGTQRNAPPINALRQQIDALIDTPELAHGYWGILVKSLRTGDILYARDAGKLLMPASNMKIITAAVAADRLGWGYVYHTVVTADGPVENGVLHGDLSVTGTGDPSLDTGVLDTWAQRLKQTGLQAIDGGVVGDDHWFAGERLGFGWSWDDLPDDYAAGVGALQLNEDRVRVTVTPGAAIGRYAGVAVDPPGSGLVIDSLVTTVSAASESRVEARRLPGDNRLSLAGQVPLGADPLARFFSVDDPAQFFVEAFRRALIARGIDVRGAATTGRAPSDPRTTRTLLDQASAPLSALATRLMKASQNQYAETFLKTIGMTAAGGTVDNGRARVRQTLGAWGVGESDIIMMDGSGLSRYDYVTPDALVRVLAHAYADPVLREPFAATLPIAGRDGTLRSRMKGTPAEANVRAKTGSMSRVRSVSGYVTTAGGEPLAFSIIANNFDVAFDAIDRASDAIMIKLAELPAR